MYFSVLSNGYDFSFHRSSSFYIVTLTLENAVISTNEKNGIYNIKNKIPVAEEIEEVKKRGSFDESLVVFTAVEKDDENNPEAIVKNLVSEVKKANEQVKAENIVLYPYAHLSSSLSSPKLAVQILKDAEEALLAENFNVKRVPFGWYKAFEISCKGHPLSELSRTITVDDNEEEKTERKPQ